MKHLVALALMPLILNCSGASPQPNLSGKSKGGPYSGGSNAEGGSGTALPGGTVIGGTVEDTLDDKVCKRVDMPIVTKIEPNTMILTTSAGRPRQRHESNGSYAGFGDHYFEKRSFEFTIEDYMATADKKIVITMKPVGKAGTGGAGLPNFRVFQNGGTNPDLFNSNNTLTALGNNVFQFTLKDSNIANQSIKPGALVAFEFGFFFDPTDVEGRTSYYSDTFRFIVGKPGMIVGVPLLDGVAGDPQAQEPRTAYSAGDHTVPGIIAEQDKHLAWSQSSLNILQPDLQAFLEGRSLFHSDFTTGKHTEQGINFSDERVAKQKGLAGPAMDTSSCASCHSHNGSFGVDNPDHADHVIKITTTDGAPHPIYGVQLQRNEQAALKLVKGSATQDVTYEDGTVVKLTKPTYAVEGALLSARVPQMVYGLGLLEAVSNESLLAQANCENSIGGRVSYAINPETGKKEVARFGWKAAKVSLKHQVSEAALLDLGVTSPTFPSASCELTGVCDAGTPELPKEDIERLVKYMQSIAVPVQRNHKDPAFARGQATFAKLGCNSCHLPQMVTGNTHPVEKLRNQTFAPYTDLLLHDMGPGLADAKKEGLATGAEWRTAPLWGLGLQKTVNGQIMLLHDGRAKSYEEAILWHGGQAAMMQAAFRKLPKADREDLYFFLGSI
jgi:CxxC motif-containing protein (DUF1111 family)